MISRRVVCVFLLLLLPLSSPFSAAPAPPATKQESGPTSTELRGRVVGDEGKPLRQAIVRVVEEAEEPEAGLLKPQASSPARAKRVETAEDGSFVVRELRFPSLVLRVEANGYAPFTERRVPVGASVRVSLKKGHPITGLVRDLSTQKPMAGATVFACDPDALRFGEEACRRATSGEGGRFQIADLPRGPVDLLARAPARAATRLSNVTVPRPAAPESPAEKEIEIFLNPGGRVSGRVVGSDGKPVGGVTLRADPLAVQLRDRQREGGAWPVMTDDLGKFAFEGLATGRYRLAAGKTGFAGAEAGPFEIKAGTDLGNLEIRLDAGAILKVRLVNPKDEPVHGLEVRIRDPRGGGGLRRDGVAVKEEQIQEGENGRYTVSKLPGGTYTVLLLPLDWADIEKEEIRLKTGETTDLGTIVVREGRSISGLVTDTAGEPVAGAQVTAFWREGPDSKSRRVPCKTDGRYRIAGLPDFPVSLITVRARGFAPAERDGASPGDAAVDFVLERTGSVVGRVEIPGGGAPAAFRVTALPEAREPEGRALRRFLPREESGERVFADPGGDFRLDDLDPGTYTLEAVADHYAPARKAGIVVAGDRVQDAGTLVLEPGIALRGRVLDARDDSPVGGALVRVDVPQTLPARRDFGPPPLGTAVSSTDGAFAIDGLRAGAVMVTADHPDYSPSRARVDLEEQEEPPEFVARMSRGGTITGAVLAAERVPVTGARVVITRASGEDTVALTTDENGRYTAERLAPGSFRVMRQSDDGRVTAQGFRMKTAVVREGETTIVDFDESSKILLSGRVRSGESPIPNTPLVFRSMDPVAAGEIKTSQSDPDGAYGIGLDRAGEYQVSVQTNGANGPMGQSSVRLAVPDLPEVQQDIVLPVSSISGRVVDIEGKGVASASVTALRDGGALSDPSRRIAAFCDPEGAYRLGGVQPGTYRVSVRSAGYRLKEIHPVEVSEEHPSPTVDFQLDRGRPLRGRVLAPQGGGIAGAMVFVAPAGSPESALFLPVQTDVNGAFQITAPAEGPVDITAVSSAWAPARVSNLTPPPEDDAEVVLRASLGGRIRVQVAGSGGQPIAGLPILVRPIPSFPGSEFAFGGNRRPGPTGPDGTTLVTMLVPGVSYEVSVPGRKGVQPAQVVVGEGEEAFAALTLP